MVAPESHLWRENWGHAQDRMGVESSRGRVKETILGRAVWGIAGTVWLLLCWEKMRQEKTTLLALEEGSRWEGVEHCPFRDAACTAGHPGQPAQRGRQRALDWGDDGC